jgi:hypothetical protein
MNQLWKDRENVSITYTADLWQVMYVSQLYPLCTFCSYQYIYPSHKSSCLCSLKPSLATSNASLATSCDSVADSAVRVDLFSFWVDDFSRLRIKFFSISLSGSNSAILVNEASVAYMANCCMTDSRTHVVCFMCST